ncbi:MAG: antitoxin [Bdellovibrio sp.]|nr:antitoxin [Bdellovibrio sp.]
MSKRLQILLPEEEYKEIQTISRLDKKTIAEWVRQSIRSSIKERVPEESEKKIARILSFAKYSGPTGDIQSLLKEIEKGRGEV